MSIRKRRESDPDRDKSLWEEGTGGGVERMQDEERMRKATVSGRVRGVAQRGGWHEGHGKAGVSVATGPHSQTPRRPWAESMLILR